MVLLTGLQFISILILCLACVNCQRINSRIINGSKLGIQAIPYVAGLLEKTSSTPYIYICGGTFVSLAHVLTAAHCVDSSVASNLLVHGGSIIISRNGRNNTVYNIFIHPNYVKSNLNNDVAVLKTTTFASIRYVQPCRLCNKALNSFDYNLVSGWGAISNTATSTSVDQIRSVNVTMIPAARCKSSYPGKISNNMFCAMGPGSNDACFGDSGSGLINNNMVCGIVSWGDGCGTRPGVYAVVLRVKSFIEECLKK